MVDHLKSRPMGSCPGSLVDGLSVWVDRKLQEVDQKISYFKKNWILKNNCSSYIYRQTHACLPPIPCPCTPTSLQTRHLISSANILPSINENATGTTHMVRFGQAALRLIMTLNIFTFGDLTFKQLNGTAMGTPPAPPYATIYYGIHEEKFLPHNSRRVIYYR